MEIGKDAQRARKQEREVVVSVLKALWTQAYTEGLVVLTYAEEDEEECDIIYHALNNYRTKVKRQKLKMYDLYLYTTSVTLSRPNKLTIKLVKKSSLYSRQTNAVLNVIKKFPELGLVEEPKKEIDVIADILKNVKEKSLSDAK